ncbi:hypothetical protein FRC05_003689 [Tulasnella sp. 425]|nr:hypothetical protein FRC05_003689 [Tulasnella sp. 425]
MVSSVISSVRAAISRTLAAVRQQSSESVKRRKALHAGSWYTDNGPKLLGELNGWLSNVTPDKAQPDVIGEDQEFSTPIPGSRAIIAPHAGYSYSGPAAAWAYKCIDTTGIKRVFILGPSHHVYLDGCALSKCDAYETPIGELPLDKETIAELLAADPKFVEMDVATDEDEHSIEMHLPYVRKAFEGLDIKIAPIMVGALPKATEQHFGKILAPYFARDDTGSRFNYTYYYPSPLPLAPDVQPTKITSSVSPSQDHPIHASIKDLDREAMEILRFPSGLPPTPAVETHNRFNTYLGKTKNTICGRHPIGVFLGALAEMEKSHDKQITLKWVRYEQSSQCTSSRDSSVSYASAYVVY